MCMRVCAPIMIFLKFGLISWFVLRQIDRDCEFLEGERIMDYSLLIGVHFCDEYSGGEMKMSPFDMFSGAFSTQIKIELEKYVGQLKSFNYCVLCLFQAEEICITMRHSFEDIIWIK